MAQFVHTAVAVPERLPSFVAGFEGFAAKAYRCPAGVITIGHGFTWSSAIFRAWWQARHGRKLQLGDRISFPDSLELLRRILAEEYLPPVVDRLGDLPDHERGAAGSVTYNCGPGALAWKWAQALKERDSKAAATRLRSTAVTAGGRRLAGLVRRRAAEANLIEFGSWGGALATSGDADELRQWQGRLVALGYDLGPAGADGKWGDATRAAVEAFQADQALDVDGILGPATKSTILRAIDSRLANRSTAGGGVAAGGADVAGQGVPDAATADPAALIDLGLQALLWGGAGAIVVGLLFLAWRYRGALTGRRVPVG